jgi:pimeloyl-ACP methyl ester carboxylesterase
MAVTVPKTSYARSGDAFIAYQVFGDGPLDVVLVPGFVSNVEHYWEMPVVPEIFERIGSFARLILFDKLGTGLSDPVTEVPTLEQRMDDLHAVLDAAGSQRAALWGISEGGPMSLLFAATHPQRTSALVLYGTTPRFSRADDFPWGWTPDVVQSGLAAIEADWGDGALMEMFAPTYVEIDEMRAVWGRYQRAGGSPSMGRRVLEALAKIDARDVLPAIGVPTLIIHRTGDRVAAVEGARYMAERISGARFVELPGDDHLPMFGDYESIVDEMEEFLTGVRRAPEPTRVLSTVMFTDIVGSTERAAEMGDSRWRRLLERHDSISQGHVSRFGGRVVKSTGDGMLATFDGPARAIRCATGIEVAVRQAGIDIRAGVHTGECELIGDDIGGMAVHIAARIAALADPSEVLVSRTVKDLVVGSGIRFADRGAHRLKGVPDEWGLYAAEI